MMLAMAIIGAMVAFVLLTAISFEFARVFFTDPIKAEVVIISIKDKNIKVREHDGKVVMIHNWPKIGKIPFATGNKITILYWPPFLFDRKAKFATFHPVVL